MDRGSSDPDSNQIQDFRDQGNVLSHILVEHPTPMRVGDLVSLIGGEKPDFPERDRTERAISELVTIGLLFRSGPLVHPTLAALRIIAICDAGF